MKWYTSSSSVAVRCVSSTNGDDRANELCVSRIKSEFDSVSPRNYSPPSVQSATRNATTQPRVSRKATYLWREIARKLLKLLQVLANLDIALAIQQQRNDGLRATRILYRLRGEEEVVRGVVVKGPVLGCACLRFARRVLEEEDDAVDGAQALELGGLERGQLFELYVLDAELLD